MTHDIKLEVEDIELILDVLRRTHSRYGLAVQSVERDLAAQPGPVDSETQTEEYIRELRDKQVKTQIIINTIECQL